MATGAERLRKRQESSSRISFNEGASEGRRERGKKKSPGLIMRNFYYMLHAKNSTEKRKKEKKKKE